MRFLIRWSRPDGAAYIQLGGDHRMITRTIHPEDGNVLIDLDKDGEVVGIELLSVGEPEVQILEDDDSKPVETITPDRDLL